MKKTLAVLLMVGLVLAVIVCPLALAGTCTYHGYGSYGYSSSYAPAYSNYNYQKLFFPYTICYNGTDRNLRNPKLFSKVYLSNSTCAIDSSDEPNFFPGKYSRSVKFPSGLRRESTFTRTPLSNHVFNIICTSTEPEVSRVHTGWVIPPWTIVKNHHIIRNRSMMNLPGQPMGIDLALTRDLNSQDTIPTRKLGSSPNPTTASFVDLAPEPIFQRDSNLSRSSFVTTERTVHTSITCVLPSFKSLVTNWANDDYSCSSCDHVATSGT